MTVTTTQAVQEDAAAVLARELAEDLALVEISKAILAAQQAKLPEAVTHHLLAAKSAALKAVHGQPTGAGK